MTTLAEALERALHLHEGGRLDEAEALYRQILARAPGHAETLHLLGVAEHQRGRHDSAIEFIGQAIAADASASRFHNSLGLANRASGRLAEAEGNYRRALALEPGFAEAMSNLANVLHQRGDIAGAIDLYVRALAIDPGHPEFHNNLGTAFADRGEPIEAERCYRRALALRPDYPDAHYHLGLVRLQLGDYAAGWRECEWRWRISSFATRRPGFRQPVWRGEALNGARILIYPEQGFGDLLQFVRYVPLVAARGGRVILGAPGALRRLFASLAGVESVIEGIHDDVDFAWYCPMLSLPLAFGTELATIPGNVPYLAAAAVEVAAWRGRISNDRAVLRVGLVWAGRRSWKQHYVRAVPAAALAPLGRVESIAFYSLQKDAAERPAGIALVDLGPALGDFADTAAAIAALDLVISVDTAVAHLAGALGKPVWILLPLVADWRWLTGRDDSPWYPTARLYRQKKPDDWQEPIARIVADLSRLAAGDASVLVPDRR